MAGLFNQVCMMFFFFIFHFISLLFSHFIFIISLKTVCFSYYVQNVKSYLNNCKNIYISTAINNNFTLHLIEMRIEKQQNQKYYDDNDADDNDRSIF